VSNLRVARQPSFAYLTAVRNRKVLALFLIFRLLGKLQKQKPNQSLNRYEDTEQLAAVAARQPNHTNPNQYG